MKKLRPYFVPVVILTIDLVTLGWRVVRQLILPTLTRKGNLLSSLFVLFTSLIEQVISFAEAVAEVPRTFELPARFGLPPKFGLSARFERAWMFSRKYLRQGMLIAAWALFVLSSFEWSGSQPAVAEKATVEQTVKQATAVSQRPTVVHTKYTNLATVRPVTVYSQLSPPPVLCPRWLLLCMLRI